MRRLEAAAAAQQRSSGEAVQAAEKRVAQVAEEKAEVERARRLAESQLRAAQEEAGSLGELVRRLQQEKQDAQVGRPRHTGGPRSCDVRTAAWSREGEGDSRRSIVFKATSLGAVQRGPSRLGCIRAKFAEIRSNEVRSIYPRALEVRPREVLLSASHALQVGLPSGA